jgi:hypothetical protein
MDRWRHLMNKNRFIAAAEVPGGFPFLHLILSSQMGIWGRNLSDSGPKWIDLNQRQERPIGSKG